VAEPPDRDDDTSRVAEPETPPPARTPSRPGARDTQPRPETEAVAPDIVEPSPPPEKERKDTIAGKSIDDWRADLQHEWFRASAALKDLYADLSDHHGDWSLALPLVPDVLAWVREPRTRDAALRLLGGWQANNMAEAELERYYVEQCDDGVLEILCRYRSDTTPWRLLNCRQVAIKRDKWQAVDTIDAALIGTGFDMFPLALDEAQVRDNWELALRAVQLIRAYVHIDEEVYRRGGARARAEHVAKATPILVRGLGIYLHRGTAKRAAARQYRALCATVLSETGPWEEMPDFVLHLIKRRMLDRDASGDHYRVIPEFFEAALKVIRDSKTGRRAAVRPLLDILRGRRRAKNNQVCSEVIRLLGELGSEARFALSILEKIANKQLQDVTQAAIEAIERG